MKRDIRITVNGKTIALCNVGGCYLSTSSGNTCSLPERILDASMDMRSLHVC